MKPFKFFQKGTLNDPQMLDEIARATASFNADTPDGHVYRRRLYHTDRDLYDRLNNPNNNNEMERYYYDRQLGRFETVRLTPSRQEEFIRRINGGMSQEEILRRRHESFERENETTKWWMKIKMFYQKFKYNSAIETNSEALGIFVITTSITIGVILIISKILNIW
jgi:uncharacterized membrane protein (DUF485 family)